MKPNEVMLRVRESLARSQAISQLEAQALSDCKELGLIELVNQLSKGESAKVLEEDLRRRITGHEPLLKVVEVQRDEMSPPPPSTEEITTGNLFPPSLSAQNQSTTPATPNTEVGGDIREPSAP